MLQLLFDVVTPCIDIIYAAHTGSCTFLLDSEGICRRIVMAPKGKRREGSRTASRCVGAQYVASLDSGAAGGLVEMPRVGAAMLFARVDERGRVSLVRTGVVTSFESNASEDPFVEVDSGTVETSAPDLATARGPDHRDARIPDPDYYDDPSERTQRIQALRPEDIAAALGDRGHGNDLTTAEYAAVVDDEPAPRKTLPSAQPASSRGMLPRRSDPHMRAAASARAYAPSAPPARASDVQISSRRRRGG